MHLRLCIPNLSSVTHIAGLMSPLALYQINQQRYESGNPALYKEYYFI